MCSAISEVKIEIGLRSAANASGERTPALAGGVGRATKNNEPLSFRSEHHEKDKKVCYEFVGTGRAPDGRPRRRGAGSFQRESNRERQERPAGRGPGSAQ